MSIAIVPVGTIDIDTLEILKDNLRIILRGDIDICKGIPIPDYALHRGRKQYISTIIVETLAEDTEYSEYDKVLGIVDMDLFASELNFVFGEAKRRGAVVSITRLKEGFYGLPADRNLFHKRVLKEAVHEIAHTYGLNHCKYDQCVMYYSTTLEETDRKTHDFCLRCKNKIRPIIFT